MAYTVNKTSGTVLTTISDGTIDTTTNLTLIGKNYAGYGEFLNENMVKLLENFANSAAPSSPVAGQIWWDTTNSLLKTYTGTAWKTVSSSTSSATTPSNSVTGDLWWDTTNGQLKVYGGSSFTTIGPAFTSGTGTSGAIVETVTDSGATDHVVVKMYNNNVVTATISKSSVFTPQSSITGFATVSPGIQLSSSVSGAKLQGTATDSDALGGSLASAYLRVDQSDSTTGVFSVLNDTGLVVGADSDCTIGVSGSDVTISNVTSNGDLLFKCNDGGVTTTVMTIDGATGKLLIDSGSPSASTGVATKAYVDAQVSGAGSLAADGSVALAGHLLPDGNNTRNLGAGATKFATIYATTFSGTATIAQYSDVAEKFTSDKSYKPGTIVALGGAEEITRVTDELSDLVFGVVSSKPAYLMNAGLTEDALPVAIAGRVPVRVLGKVNKGDRLVSAGNGLARAAQDGEATSFNVIGRAIQSKTTDEAGTVESFVTIN
jgi:hypothetical protein